MTIDLQSSMRAVSILLNVEHARRISGTCLLKTWKRESPPDEPHRTIATDFEVNRDDGSWWLKDQSQGHEERETSQMGRQQVIGGQTFDLPSDAPDPPQMQMLSPTRMKIWGRPGDLWVMQGAEVAEGGLLTHFAHNETATSTAELLISDSLGLPIRWTAVHEATGIRTETEMVAASLDATW